MISKFTLSTFSVGVLLLAACSSTPPVNELPVTASVNDEMIRLDEDLKQAENKQVNVLAPKNFEKASDSLDKAREARNHNKDQKNILHKISIARAYLDKANQVAAVSAQVLPKVIQERQDAMKAQAQKYYSKDFSDADSDLREATGAIEDNDTSLAEKNKGALESTYNGLELAAIKKEKIAPAGDTLEEAKKEGAKKLVPSTLSWAEDKIKNDDATITNNRHDTAAVDQASSDAINAANRVLNLVRHSKEVTAENPEQNALQWEKDQNVISQKDQALNQVNGEVQNKQQTIATLANQNEKLNSETKVDRYYDFATKQFSKNEAEVYKQGDKLVLRLKGLTFPKDQAIITTTNYPLLAKVQTVIQETDPKNVVVEGHTDSTGSKTINMKLSDQRAKAVETYLVSNNTISSDVVSAKGFGDTKPIASNKTATGRAQNRRVDVIISAGDTEASPQTPPTSNQ